MKYKIALTSFFAVALILTFSGQVQGAEVTGNLSSSITPGSGSSGSQVTGTLGNSTIAGTVGNGNGTITGNVSGGGSSGGGGGGSSSGSVLGVATNGPSGSSSNPQGQVLGATTTPGFPVTGLGFEVTPGTISLIGLTLSLCAVIFYFYRRTRINA